MRRQANRIATSILDALVQNDVEIHQVLSKHSTLSAPKSVIIHRSDFSVNSLREVFQNAAPDLLISTFAGGSYEIQRTIIDAAVAAGVCRFIPADFGNDTLNQAIRERLPPSRERAQVIAYLRDLSSGGHLEWSAVATGCLLDHGLKSGSLGFDIQWQSATLHGSGSERFAASSVAWIGQVILSVIQHWDEVRNQYLYAAGFTTTANEILQCLEWTTGQQWEAGRGDVEDCVHEAERRIDRGFPDAGMFLMERSILYDEKLDAVRPFVEKDAKARLGLKGEQVKDVVESAVHQHDHHGKGGCGCD